MTPEGAPSVGGASSGRGGGAEESGAGAEREAAADSATTKKLDPNPAAPEI